MSKSKIGLLIIIIASFTIVLSAISTTRACGCDCSAQYFGFKSYITGKEYPPIRSERKSNSFFDNLPCFCACQSKLRFPLEIIPVYIIAIWLSYYYLTKRLR